MDEIKENDNQMNKSDVILKRRIPSARELKKMLARSTNKKRPKCGFKFQDAVHADEEESRVKKPKSPVKSKIKGNKEKRKSVTLKAAEKKLDIYKRLSPDNTWVAPPSEYELLQEKHCFDPWRVLVICILLNVTQGCQARAILPDFFELVPNAEAATEVAEEELRELIRPLGIFNKRAALIKEFSAAYLSSDWTHVTCLPGVNKYAADAYAIFCVGRPEDVTPCDHKLVDYWKFLCEKRARVQEN